MRSGRNRDSKNGRKEAKYGEIPKPLEGRKWWKTLRWWKSNYQPYKDGGSVKETGKIESVEGIFMCAKTFFVVVSPTVNQTRDHVFRFSRCVVYVCVCAQMSYGKGKKKGKVVTEWSNRDGRNRSQIAWLPPACFPWFSRWPPTPFDPANDEQTRVAQANWNGPLSPSFSFVQRKVK